MNTIKTTVKIAGFLLVVLLALGCGGSTQGPISSATPDGKFLYVTTARTEAAGVSAYRVDGLRGSLMPTAPAEFATTGGSEGAEGRFVWHCQGGSSRD